MVCSFYNNLVHFKDTDMHNLLEEKKMGIVENLKKIMVRYSESFTNILV